MWVSIALFVPVAFQAQALSGNVQQDFIITQEAIDEANNLPNTPYIVEFTPKMEREIRIMEKRHFKNPIVDETDEYRIERLEEELMGKVWRYTPLATRIRRLKLASQRTTLAGTSLPPSMNRIYTPKRIHNDSVELKEKDKVGIIDGLLRLYSPKRYEAYKAIRERQFERYSE